MTTFMVKPPRKVRELQFALHLAAVSEQLPSAAKARLFLKSYVRFERIKSGCHPFRNPEQQTTNKHEQHNIQGSSPTQSGGSSLLTRVHRMGGK